MVDVLRIKDVEISVNTANVVSNSSIVRVFNNNAAAQLITIANSSANVASITINSKDSIVIRKNPTDTVQGTTCLAVPIYST